MVPWHSTHTGLQEALHLLEDIEYAKIIKHDTIYEVPMLFQILGSAHY